MPAIYVPSFVTSNHQHPYGSYSDYLEEVAKQVMHFDQLGIAVSPQLSGRYAGVQRIVLQNLCRSSADPVYLEMEGSLETTVCNPVFELRVTSLLVNRF